MITTAEILLYIAEDTRQIEELNRRMNNRREQIETHEQTRAEEREHFIKALRQIARGGCQKDAVGCRDRYCPPCLALAALKEAGIEL